MKQVLSLIFILFIGSKSFSQTGVFIHEDPRIEANIQRLTTRIIATPVANYVYNIQLISTYDRNEANSVKAEYQKFFPGKQASLSYNNPRYIIRVGDFTSEIEARNALAKVREKFPSAFLLPPQKMN